MIDLKTVQAELENARFARISAQQEGCSIEQIVGLMRQPWQASVRLDLTICGDLDERVSH